MKKLNIIALLLIILTSTTVTSAQHDHEGGPLEIIDGVPIPDVNITIYEDLKKGWNILVETTNFTFSPEHVSSEHIWGEGHSHIYIDRVKTLRFFGEWYNILDLSPGTHEIRLTLNANDHSDLGVEGKVIQDVELIEVPGMCGENEEWVLYFSLDHMTHIGTGHLEGWAIYGEEKISTGKFQMKHSDHTLVNLHGEPVMQFRIDRDLMEADMFVITVEPEGDTDDIPSGDIWASGIVYGSTTELTDPSDSNMGIGHALLYCDSFPYDTIDDLEIYVTELTTEIASKESTILGLESEVSDLEEDISSCLSDNDSLEDDVSILDERVQFLENEVSILEDSAGRWTTISVVALLVGLLIGALVMNFYKR